MCKNAGNPCPGCRKHKTPEAAWVFFTDEELAAIETLGKPMTPLRAASRR